VAQVAASLLPIVLVILLGSGLAWSGFLAAGFRKHLDRFVFWVALPCLLVAEVGRSDFTGTGVGALTLVLIGGTLAASLLGVAAAWMLRLPPAGIGVMVQSAMRGNLIFVGLPVLLFALGVDGSAADSPLAQAALIAIAPLVVLYNLIAVVALLVPHHRLGWGMMPQLVKPIVTNPFIIACVLGMLLALSGWVLPAPVDRSLRMVGHTAPALALIGLGASLIELPVRGSLVAATVASLIKVAALPAIVWLLGLMVGLSSEHMLVAVLFSATPTAVASYVLVTQLKGDAALAASSVVVSTVLSLPAMGVALYMFG
jgi:predicted permease